jgi:pimeloyl-ACP methyl ester carboxylesterase
MHSMISLILVPGLAGNHVMWRSQAEALREFDPHVTDVHMRHESIEAMAAALLDETEGDLVVCGASMGGMIAMETARQAPRRVKGLALLGTIAAPETEEMRRLRENAIEFFAQGRVDEIIRPNVRFAFHPEHASDEALAKAYLDFIEEAGAEQLIRQNRAVIARPDARSHLPRLPCPVLVMCGDADQLAPLEHSRGIASLAPHAELVIVPRCGHMLTMEQPAFVSDRLREWLTRVPGFAPSR